MHGRRQDSLFNSEAYTGGRDRDRTCDPYHVKKACEVEAVGNQGTRVAVSGTGGTCSKDVPRPVVAYDQRALPITGIPDRSFEWAWRANQC
jgi:hypothetical protein